MAQKSEIVSILKMAEIAPVPSVPDTVVPVPVVSVVPVVIFYDLETTDFNQRNCHRDVQIVSIGAVNGNTGDEYHKVSLFFLNMYVLASKTITLFH